MWQNYLHQELKKYLADAKKRNKRYSLRSLAKKCDLSASTVSEVLSGKKALSGKVALKLLPHINLSAEKQIELLHLIQENKLVSRRLLTPNQDHLIENWHAFAILNLFELKLKIQTSAEVAERLNLPTELVQKTIADLIQLGLLIEEKGKIYSSGKHWKSTDEISSSTIKKSHAHSLQTALQALNELPVEIRDFTSIIFPGNPKQLKKAKTEVRKFLEKMAKIMSQGDLESVYKLNVQVFPLDQWQKK